MLNLTPIPLTIEEHESLIAIKHRLEAGSWREMLMKPRNTYEDILKTPQPTTRKETPELKWFRLPYLSELVSS